jgi:hypothetical protein
VSKTSRSGGGEHNQPGFHGVLRLVEDDTAALHIFKTRSQKPWPSFLVGQLPDGVILA